MAKVAEDIRRVASDITSDRRQRRDLAMAIKNATRARHREVRSMLDGMKASRLDATEKQAEAAEKMVKARRRETVSLLKDFKASRVKMGREQATEAKRVMRDRRHAVHSMLSGMRSSRGRAARQYRAEAIMVVGKRRSDVASFLRQRRTHRKMVATVQRENAAALMRDLTNGVASMLDNFDRDGRDRAARIRKRLSSYAADRRDVVVIWQGISGERSQPAKSSTSSSAPAHPAKAESSAPPMCESAAHEAGARQPKRPFGNLGQKPPGERHSEGSK